jgi:hypothetical protein
MPLAVLAGLVVGFVGAKVLGRRKS